MDGKNEQKSAAKKPGPAWPWKTSKHGRNRLTERNVTDEQLAYVLKHGNRIRKTGITFVFLGWRDIPREDRRLDCYAKLEGAVVLVARDGTVITLYRNKDALIDIRKKLKYRRPDRVRRRPRRPRVMPEVEMTPEGDEE